MSFKLPDLNYSYDALEPYIDARTMEIHHSKHHAGYVTKLNKALEEYPQFQSLSICELMTKLHELPEFLRTAVRNNGGGHFNHYLFWEIMAPGAGGQPKGELLELINRDFGSFEKFKKDFATAAATRFGSGWAWLYKNEGGRLRIGSTPNQDNPMMSIFAEIKGVPVLALDVWEHAYYLKYQNKRPDYIEAWFNVINWDKVLENFKIEK